MSGRPMSSMMASGWKRRASDSTAIPSPVTTPLKPPSRTSDSRMAAKRGSSSTISTTESSRSISSRSSCTASRASTEALEADTRNTGALTGMREGWVVWAAGLKLSGR